MSKKKINYLADAVTLVEEDLSVGLGIDSLAGQVMECLRGGAGFVGCYYDSTLGRTSLTTVI